MADDEYNRRRTLTPAPENLDRPATMRDLFTAWGEHENQCAEARTRTKIVEVSEQAKDHAKEAEAQAEIRRPMWTAITELKQIVFSLRSNMRFAGWALLALGGAVVLFGKYALIGVFDEALAKRGFPLVAPPAAIHSSAPPAPAPAPDPSIPWSMFHSAGASTK